MSIKIESVTGELKGLVGRGAKPKWLACCLPRGREILQPHHLPIFHRAAEHFTAVASTPSNLKNADLMLKTEQH
jgi:hypothetical protein